MSIGTRFKKALINTIPRRYQIQGVRFIEKNNGRAIIGDEMRLGKTLQAIGWLATHPEAYPVIIICPATLKYQWQDRLYLRLGFESMILHGEKTKGLEYINEENKNKIKWFPTKEKRTDFITIQKKKIIKIIKNLQKKKKKNKNKIKQLISIGKNENFNTLQRKHTPFKSNILILNYKILIDWIDKIKTINPELLIIDECHYLRYSLTERTSLCKELSMICNYIIPLSGTPIEGNPVEFFPILNMVSPKKFPSFFKYAFRYCDLKKSKYHKGWDFTGSSNLEELHQRISQVMIRRTKVQVLKYLPKKTRTTIPIDISNFSEYTKAKESFLEWVKQNQGIDKFKKAKKAEAIVRINALRQLIGIGKIETACQMIKNWFEETDKKLVVFAIHKKVLNPIIQKFPNAAVIIGEMNSKKRNEEEKRFQNDPNCKLFIGGLKSARHGIDLSSSSHTLTIELGWTFEGHKQAEDRVLKIEEKTKSINADYLFGKDTIDIDIYNTIQKKRKICDAVLDGIFEEGRKEETEKYENTQWMIIKSFLNKEKEGG